MTTGGNEESFLQHTDGEARARDLTDKRQEQHNHELVIVQNARQTTATVRVSLVAGDRDSEEVVWKNALAPPAIPIHDETRQ